jgi:hypothetical protein
MTELQTLFERAKNQRLYFQELCGKQEKLSREMLDTIEAIIALSSIEGETP